MKKILSVFIILIALLIQSSCKKDSDTNAGKMLIGTWALTEIGSDNNANDKVDEGETFPPDPDDTFDTMTFRSDNTYTDNYQSGGVLGIHRNDTGTWTFSNNRINLITTSVATYIPVNSLTNNNLVTHVEDLWGIYIKQ